MFYRYRRLQGVSGYGCAAHRRALEKPKRRTRNSIARKSAVGTQPALVVLEAGRGSKHRLPAQWQLLACLWQLSIPPGQGLRQSHREACKNGTPWMPSSRKIPQKPCVPMFDLCRTLMHRNWLPLPREGDRSSRCSSPKRTASVLLIAASANPKSRNIDWLENNWPRSMETSPILSVKALWREKDNLLKSAPGVGPVLAVTLLADLPELGSLTRKQTPPCLVWHRSTGNSGTLRGKRTIWGGRANVRQTLYMSALAATRHNPVIRDFYERLRVAGKPGKVALIACMRKLLTILNAMLKHQMPWKENFIQTA